jgi:2Fe-2S ferredoxin
VGLDSLDPSEDEEDDMLDKAWGLESNSRLSCQTTPVSGEFTVELPKYTINQVSEDH